MFVEDMTKHLAYFCSRTRCILPYENLFVVQCNSEHVSWRQFCVFSYDVFSCVSVVLNILSVSSWLWGLEKDDVGSGLSTMSQHDDEEVSGEIDEFAMFQARSLGAESEYLLLKQASRHHHQQTAATPRSSSRAGALCLLCVSLLVIAPCDPVCHEVTSLYFFRNSQLPH